MTFRVGMFNSGRPLMTAPTKTLSSNSALLSRAASIHSMRTPGKRA
jgi:hypothetical protein